MRVRLCPNVGVTDPRSCLVILPELSSLPVDHSYNLRAVDENVVRKEVAVSEMNLCVRREVAEKLLYVLRPTDVKERLTVVVEVLHGDLGTRGVRTVAQI